MGVSRLRRDFLFRMDNYDGNNSDEQSLSWLIKHQAEFDLQGVVEVAGVEAY